MSTPEARLADRNWRWTHSKWLLVPILGAGLFTVFSLLYAGRKLNDGLITRIALALALPTAVIWVTLGTSDSESGSNRPIDNVATALLIGLWIGGAIYCVKLNRLMLRLHADAETGPWYTQQQTSNLPLPAQPFASQGGDWTNTLSLDQVQRTAFTTPTAPSPAPDAVLALAQHAEQPGRSTPVDVNTADEATLRTLPGVGPALAKRIVAHRASRGGIGTLQELAAAGVPPHILAGIVDSVTFGGRPTPPPRGRILDV